jgi:non-specific serine/threonine protein kinase
MPAPLTSLIGRERELATLISLVGSSHSRLVTLTGVGGAGKTRLALEAGKHLQGAFEDGVVFVDLSPLRDAEFVIPTIAAALGVRERPGQALLETLASALNPRRTLLLLDNCEQVLAAVPAIAALLAGGPRLSMLATSRESLRIRGEHEFPLLPLPLPAHERVPEVEAVAREPTVALFVERAQASEARFTLTRENAAVVAAICRRLDGLPLAIELAAPKIKMLPAPALLARLEHRLPLLTGGGRDLPARQRTMRDAIAWSYDLLSSEEQALFRRVAVFAGGFTLAAAEAIAGAEGAPAVLDGIAVLIEQSLLRQIPVTEEEPRYVMLETVREFGLERLRAAGEDETSGRRHLAAFLALAEEAESHLISAVEAGWIDRIEREHDNIRAALNWALHPERAVEDRIRGLRLAGALWLFWYYHSHLHEGRHWLERALVIGESVREADHARAKALVGLGTLAHFQGDDDIARPYLDEGIDRWRALGDPVGLAYALTVRGNVAEDSGAYAEAEQLFTEAGDLFRQVGDPVNTAVTLYHLGVVRYGQGDLASAEQFCHDALALGRQTGDPWSTAAAQAYLGLIYTGMGFHQRAAASLAEAVALYQRIGTAERLVEVVRRTAVLGVEAGAPDSALMLLAGADAMAVGIGAAQALPERAAYERAWRMAEDALGGDVAREAIAAGRAMTADEVVILSRRVLNEYADEQGAAGSP